MQINYLCACMHVAPVADYLKTIVLLRGLLWAWVMRNCWWRQQCGLLQYLSPHGIRAYPLQKSQRALGIFVLAVLFCVFF